MELAGTAPEFFEDFLENLLDAAYVVDRNLRLVHWNRAAEEVSGFRKEDLLGRHCSDHLLKHVDEEGSESCNGENCPLQAVIDTGQPTDRNAYLLHQAGHRVPVRLKVSPLRNESGDVVGAIQIFRSNAVEHNLLARLETAERMAYFDALTGLPNRRFLEATLESRLAELERYGWGFGVLLLDIDHLKKANDTFGHEVGDQVLQMVARTFKASTRSPDLVGRWGGDEFLALISNVSRQVLVDVGERLRLLIARSQLRQSPPLGVSLSVGAALATPGITANALLREADQRLYEAKTSGRNRVCS